MLHDFHDRSVAFIMVAFISQTMAIRYTRKLLTPVGCAREAKLQPTGLPGQAPVLPPEVAILC